MKARQRTLLAVLILAAMGSSACAQQGAQPSTSATDEQELKTLTGQLTDPTRTAQTKREAAGLLLNRSYPEAVSALRDCLLDSANPAAQIAVAEAIEGHGGDDKGFIEPLLRMLTGADPAVSAAAARAIAAYKNQGVAEKLVAVATDSNRDRNVRLTVIRCLGSTLDPKAIEALLTLLDDKDKPIRQEAAESLARLTNIRAFGSSAEEWKRWWARNRNKDRAEWLADLANSLSKTRTALEAENLNLRDRLARMAADLYAAAPAARQESLLLEFLKDPLADIRMVGTALVRRRIAANEPVSPEICGQVRAMLADSDERVRQASALLTASLGDGDSLAVLLDRLSAEKSPLVRQGLLTALGQLRDPRAMEAVLKEVSARDEKVAAAAAAALARIAETGAISGQDRSEAVKALVGRYELTAAATDGVELREALLTAMGEVGDKEFVKALVTALKDPAATVRLAAVNALARLGDGEVAGALDPLAGDPDRGVRQAAIAALGKVGGLKHLPTILKQTDPTIESDAAVRQQAWKVTMSLLADADADSLRGVADSLKDRTDALDQRIQILQMLTEKLASSKDATQAAVRRQLGLALLQAGRPAEAVPQIAASWGLYDQLGDAQALDVWREWVSALLAADDPDAIKAMDEQTNDAAFAEALKLLQARLEALRGESRYGAAASLAKAALDQLPHRLTVAQRQELDKVLTESRAGQTQADRREVAKLVVQLQSPEEATRSAALNQLRTMGDQAVQPLLEELKASITAAEPNAQSETAILSVLGEIAPEFTRGYDPSAAAADKVKRIDGWRKPPR